MARSCTSLEPGQLIRIKHYYGFDYGKQGESQLKNQIVMYVGEGETESFSSYIEVIFGEKVVKLYYVHLEYEVLNKNGS